MTNAPQTEPFFIGYVNSIPAQLARFLLLVGLAFAAGMGAAAFVISASVDDPGNSRYAKDLGYKIMTGYLEQTPYPVLRILPDDDFPKGRAIVVSGRGKRGVQGDAAKFDGKIVDVGGYLLKRGDVEMLQLSGKVGIRPTEAAITQDQQSYIPAAAQSLGRWRLTGEICDGKCYTGAMQPGRGISHRACANVCINGGVPAVFVSTGPVEGTNFLLLADKRGRPLPDLRRDLVALMIEIEGDIERRDDLLVFKVDLDQAKVL